MAVSKCPKCDNTTFELKELKVKGSHFRMFAVQCALCGAVVAVKDYNNTAATLQQLANKLGVTLDI